MNKNAKPIILIIAVIIVATLAATVYFINSSNQIKKSIEAVSLTSSVAPGEVVPLQTTPVAPVYSKKVEVEFMSETEKTQLGLPTEMKIQVLERDKTGKITAYKIIRQDSDIMTTYGN